MAEIFLLDGMNKFQHCVWRWDQTPFNEQRLGLEGNTVGTGPSYGHQGSQWSGPLIRQQESTRPGLNHGQEGYSIQGPSNVQGGIPAPGVMQGQEITTVSVPVCGRRHLLHGNPVQSHLKGAGVSSVNRRKRIRTCFTTEQLRILEEAYTVSHFCAANERANLSSLLNVEQKAIKNWFQNRRSKEKHESQILSLDISQPANVSQDNRDNNKLEYSPSLSLSQYWQLYASEQNEYLISGNSGSALGLETASTQSALTVENVKNMCQNTETTSSYCENYVNRHLIGVDNEALSQASSYPKLSSNELNTSCYEMYVPKEYQNSALENRNASTLDAITQSVSLSQKRCAGNAPTTSFLETFEPMDYNVCVSYDSENVSKIDVIKSTNSPQNYGSPTEHSNERNRCGVPTNIKVSDGDTIISKFLSSNEEKSKKQSDEKNQAIIKEDIYELPLKALSSFFIDQSVPELQNIDDKHVYNPLFGVDTGVHPTMCYAQSDQLYDIDNTTSLATNVYGTQWTFNN